MDLYLQMHPIIFSGEPFKVYVNACRSLSEHGTIASPRGLRTKEFYNTTFYLDKPWESITMPYGRAINIALALAEVHWILNGMQDVDTLSYFSTQIAQYSDDGNVFNAPYGWRMRKAFGVDQLQDAISKLQQDPDTRQAIMTYTLPNRDQAGIVTKDRPCNITSQFIARQGHLSLTQNMRSNDLFYGTAFNWIQWSHVLRYVAESLGLPMGTLTFNVGVLHLYEPDWVNALQVEPYNPWELVDTEWNSHGNITRLMPPRSLLDLREADPLYDETEWFEKNRGSSLWEVYKTVFWASHLFRRGFTNESMEYVMERVPYPLNILLLKNMYQWRIGKQPSLYRQAAKVEEFMEELPGVEWLKR